MANTFKVKSCSLNTIWSEYTFNLTSGTHDVALTIELTEKGYIFSLWKDSKEHASEFEPYTPFETECESITGKANNLLKRTFGAALDTKQFKRRFNKLYKEWAY